ncbi:replication initiation protein [Pseudomonas sp. R5(2019)]|uniref:replication initiation protein n=1 Tax=Pseudomonas sp. R5(2019) TaxID=2697566 RepID=UPI001411F2E7|nr:replication initiation protein [Pseudomonas sp. R5(2019)]NBA98608.1 RepB family plasmid replication initiator protein [Pseudomonas sp. R5(2019)]
MTADRQVAVQELDPELDDLVSDADLPDEIFDLEDDSPSAWKRVISQSNVLISSSYHLSLTEIRLLRLCMSSIDARKPFRHKRFLIRASDYAETFKVTPDAAYLALNDAANTLFEREIRLGNSKSGRRIRWISEIKYHKGMGEVEIHFTDQVIPQITGLNRLYTQYRTGSIVDLTSVYSVRIYEWLCQFRSTGWMKIRVTELRDRLNLLESYPKFNDLRRRVIDVAINEINKSTDLNVEVEFIKRGRSIEMIEFKFTTQPVQTILNLEPTAEELEEAEQVAQ